STSGGPNTVFDLSVGRSNDCPQAFLRGFKGFLQADGYSGCDARRLLGACSTMLGEAFTSALNQWPTWTVDVTGGRLKIDNHPAEQAIRPLAIGRRNWLHVGGDGGLNPTAVLLSLAASAKRHALNPWDYYRVARSAAQRRRRRPTARQLGSRRAFHSVTGLTSLPVRFIDRPTTAARPCTRSCRKRGAHRTLTLIALSCRHTNSGGIFVLNFFLGWTG
ncbi:MAG: hypothetical protein EXS09_17820, partial [Gemmataceae bacterium]|nr:hypothetical protein [Gemmataceae bacterium]